VEAVGVRSPKTAALVLCSVVGVALSTWAPAQAPLSESILFVPNHEGIPAESGLYLMDPDGSNVRRFLADITGPSWPVWSRDGSQLALGVSQGGNPPTIRVTDPDGDGPRAIAPEDLWSSAPTWAPDGSKVTFTAAFQGILNVYVANVATAEAVAMTNRVDPAGGWRPSTDPSWAPDGRRIAFSAWKHNNGDAPRYIWSMAPDGSDMRALVTHESHSDSPAYSRDGSKIAFMSNRNGPTNIYTVNADGSGLRRVTREGDDRRPIWSPDGSRIVFYRQPAQFAPPRCGPSTPTATT